MNMKPLILKEEELKTLHGTLQFELKRINRVIEHIPDHKPGEDTSKLDRHNHFVIIIENIIEKINKIE